MNNKRKAADLLIEAANILLETTVAKFEGAPVITSSKYSDKNNLDKNLNVLRSGYKKIVSEIVKENNSVTPNELKIKRIGYSEYTDSSKGSDIPCCIFRMSFTSNNDKYAHITAEVTVKNFRIVNIEL